MYRGARGELPRVARQALDWPVEEIGSRPV